MTALDLRALDEQALEQRPCPVIGHELRVLLAEAAFDRAVERGAADTSREIGGVLVGELLRDDAGPYLQITATIDALHAEEKGAELTFTHATWEHIHKEMDGAHQGQRLVGWYHTHPGFGVFLSDRDQFIHQSFFDLPFQVAFVYDPKSREHGMFAWRDGTAARMRRFWIGGREQTWDGDRHAAGAKGAAGKSAARAPGDSVDGAARELQLGSADREGPRDDASAPWPFVAFAAVLCLCLGGLAGHWLGAAGGQRAAQLSQLELMQLRTDSTPAAVALLHGELVGLVRRALDAEAVSRPLTQAVTDLDQSLAVLRSLPGADAEEPGWSRRGGLWATLGLAPLAQLGGPPPERSPLATELRRLDEVRRALARLALERQTAHATLRAVEHEARRQDEHALLADHHRTVGREVAAQRAGLGGLYAELGADAARAGDHARARRLLAAAAQLDPGNRARYEAQLQAPVPPQAAPLSPKARHE